MVISSVRCFVFYNFSKTLIGRQAMEESLEKIPLENFPFTHSYIEGSIYFWKPSLSERYV